MEQTAKTAPPSGALPKHIGLIMDGNGRWAASRGLPREFGHRAGAKTFTKLVTYCRQIGIQTVTAYAFSTENWRRPEHEVRALMQLLTEYLSDTSRYMDEDAKVTFLGDLTPLDDGLQAMIRKAERESRNRTGIRVNVAINYGGRDEILFAARALARDCVQGRFSPEDITAESFAGRLYTAGQPDPDVIIRPSGEQRLSNFLLWQAAYAELIFMDVLWPDFSPEHLNWALAEFARRDRRFGGI